MQNFDVYIILFGANESDTKKFREYFDNKVSDICSIKIPSPKKIIKAFNSIFFKGNFYDIYYSKKVRNYLFKYISNNEINIIYANFFYLTYIFDELKFQDMTKIVDVVDAVSLHMEEAENVSFARRIFYSKVKSEVLGREIKSIKSSSVTFITSYKEKSYFLDKIDNKNDFKKIQTLWNGVDESYFEVGSKRLLQINNDLYNVKNKIGFIGSLDYYPNDIAAQRLTNKIFPKIHNKNESLELYIIGKSPSRKLQRICSQNNKIKLLGYVPNLEDILLNLDMLVLPMTIASGIQNKLLTGLSAALPVIISSRALFSDELVNQKNIITCETDKDYIMAILELYENPERILYISRYAYEFANKYLHWDNILSKFLDVISDSISERPD
jgi:glycosyltransferase involved in cell wall biosynthesis